MNTCKSLMPFPGLIENADPNHVSNRPDTSRTYKQILAHTNTQTFASDPMENILHVHRLPKSSVCDTSHSNQAHSTWYEKTKCVAVDAFDFSLFLWRRRYRANTKTHHEDTWFTRLWCLPSSLERATQKTSFLPKDLSVVVDCGGNLQ